MPTEPPATAPSPRPRRSPAELLRRRRGTTGLVVGALGATAVTGGLAYAAIPSASSGQFTGCVASSGAVRLVDADRGARCRSGERTVRWSSGYRFRGAWSASTSYAAQDVVTQDGGSYVARRASRGVAPTDAGTWGVLAAAGATGPAGPAGPAGSGGPVSADRFEGPIDAIPGGSSDYVFAGGTVQLVVGTGQRVVASGTAVLGVSGGASSVRAVVSICGRQVGRSRLVDLSGVQGLTVPIDKGTLVPISATSTPSAGIYDVGLCVANGSATTLNANGSSLGWAMVLG
ncbi:hypothetical protein K8Z61_00115 [Nocardioides sp. TRM66260-LWL]|uniref:hypothetical protein n=1 Tax=Nocardioides sp. TRM66260-LWL TaxID=2874478 RepID=UPI001CC5F8CB|nr:hypothetical protein [Nocardioides sp. TRM66260-LWL]MBZ5732891.1 hypothetical protein [Nocardioides sp. TRM66260-LWL]